MSKPRKRGRKVLLPQRSIERLELIVILDAIHTLERIARKLASCLCGAHQLCVPDHLARLINISSNTPVPLKTCEHWIFWASAASE